MSTTTKKTSTGRTTDESTSSKLAAVAHSAIDTAASKASEVEASLREGTQEAKLKAKAAGREVKARSSDIAGSVKQYVDENPGKSIGIAFLAGLIASKILRR